MEAKKTMETQKDYKHMLVVKASPKDATDRIGEVNHWWAKKVKGRAAKVNDEFSVHFGSTFVNFRVTELVSGKKIVWLVTDCYLDWINDKSEWKNTTVTWTLSRKDGKTIIEFLHLGVTPDRECYESCNAGWTHHLDDSLQKLIENGKGFPE